MVHLSNTLEMFLVVVDIVIICKYSIKKNYKHMDYFKANLH